MIYFAVVEGDEVVEDEYCKEVEVAEKMKTRVCVGCGSEKCESGNYGKIYTYAKPMQNDNIRVNRGQK